MKKLILLCVGFFHITIGMGHETTLWKSILKRKTDHPLSFIDLQNNAQAIAGTMEIIIQRIEATSLPENLKRPVIQSIQAFKDEGENLWQQAVSNRSIPVERALTQYTQRFLNTEKSLQQSVEALESEIFTDELTSALQSLQMDQPENMDHS